MRLEGIRAGDIIEVDRLGRRFHVLVGGSAEGGLSMEPLDRRVTSERAGLTRCGRTGPNVADLASPVSRSSRRLCS
jgi:hypothetical protein